MKASTKLRRHILEHAGLELGLLETEADVNDAWVEADDAKYDVMSDVRSGDFVTNIPSPWSRHYESRSVAAKMSDGSWVGWTYWHGGGKHGCPKEIDWIEDAYYLDCVESVEVVTVRKWAKSEGE